MRLVLIFVLVACLIGCSSANDARRALEGAGYTNIHTDGYRFFGCGKEDTFKTGFSAVGPTGKRVTGVVCSSWTKGSTIRTD